jgi:hypothetical protein
MQPREQPGTLCTFIPVNLCLPAAFKVSDLDSNRLAGIKLLNWSNLCTRS